MKRKPKPMTPNSASPGDAEPFLKRLASLRQSLLDLHKALIESERVAYEQTFGTIESPNQFLQLLIQDPWFAWLHPLSELVVEIDEALEADEPVNAQLVTNLMNQARNLLKASEVGHDFARNYFEALQREPDVVLAHAGVVRCLKGK